MKANVINFGDPLGYSIPHNVGKLQANRNTNKSGINKQARHYRFLKYAKTLRLGSNACSALNEL